MKLISHYKVNFLKFNKEIQILNNIKHPYIVEYIDCFLDIDENNEFFVIIIMKYYPEGDLNGYTLKNYPLSEDIILEILIQIVEGIEYLHKNKIVHRDLKVSEFTFI